MVSHEQSLYDDGDETNRAKSYIIWWVLYAAVQENEIPNTVIQTHTREGEGFT